MEKTMNQDVNFSYNYSAKENEEIQAIRKRYLPQEETKLDELRRLDEQVRKSGTAAALCVGIISSLIFGLGMCLAMQVIGNGIAMMILGIIVGIIGMGGMFLAYPTFKKEQRKAKTELSGRILKLAEELEEA